MEYEYLRSDGSTFWGELHCSFTRDQDGEVSGIQGVLRDISDRKRAEAERAELEAQLHQAERLRSIGRLAGGIAHDFNNQLAGITGYAELLKAKKRGDPTVQNHADQILIPARRAADLTSKLLAFARRGNYRAEPVDLHAIVREAIAILERSIAKNITIAERLDAPRCLVFGDPTLLQSAVLNVALNARDAMPEGGEIEFWTELAEWTAKPGEGDSARRGEHILLHVRDTGEGMDAATLRRGFEPFFTTKPVGQGTGMGLAAVHGTLHSHGGMVKVESAPGKGTTLTLVLPLLDESFFEGRDADSRGLVGGKGHILVVDDEPMMRNIAAGLLEHVGYRVTTSGRPLAALDLYAAQFRSIDLVLLDMVLPELGGAEVFRALRKVNPAARVLLFSGYSPDGDVQELLRKGAVGFVQKPFSLAEISERVAEALRSNPPGN
jgi:signal transduction histidine kinase/CheY-like chemotaxis protein